MAGPTTCHRGSEGLKPGYPARHFVRWCRMVRCQAAVEDSMSQQDGQPWDTGGDLPWASSDDEDQADSAWRGDLHLDDWPENLAGPEYWLYKKQRDE
jgi:hypothetical protein